MLPEHANRFVLAHAPITRNSHLEVGSAPPVHRKHLASRLLKLRMTTRDLNCEHTQRKPARMPGRKRHLLTPREPLGHRTSHSFDQRKTHSNPSPLFVSPILQALTLKRTELKNTSQQSSCQSKQNEDRTNCVRCGPSSARLVRCLYQAESVVLRKRYMRYRTPVTIEPISPKTAMNEKVQVPRSTYHCLWKYGPSHRFRGISTRLTTSIRQQRKNCSPRLLGSLNPSMISPLEVLAELWKPELVGAVYQ